MSYKVCVYAICKNEERFVDKWMDSMKEADCVIACDTGSSDSTVEKLKALGADVHIIHVTPWRFDVARNCALSFVPSDCDICVSTDLDEILESGWREKLEKAWTAVTTRLRYMYTWKFNEDGLRGLTYWYDKIHARYGYRWINPVHETVRYIGDKQEIYAAAPDVQLNHFPDPAKARGQYLSLLELSRKENPQNSSTVFWLGREYMFYGRYDQSIAALNDHLALQSAVWDQERSTSMRYIARCHKAKGDAVKVQEWLFKAIAECPSVREPYMELARWAYEQKDWPLVYCMTDKALCITEKPASYLTEDFCWNATPYDLGAIACYQMGMYQKSFELAAKAVEANPTDERLKNNLALIKAKIE